VIRPFALAGLLICTSLAALPGPTDTAEAATVGTPIGRAVGHAANTLGKSATQVADINGDGRADVFTYRSNDNAYLVSYSGTTAWTTLAHGVLDPERTWLADMNGDGSADVFTHRASDNAFLVSYGASSNWHVLAYGYIDPAVTRLGDLTGDGKADVFTLAADGRWLLSDGGTQSWVTINGGAFPAASTYLGDINGDGREDVVAIHADGSWRVSYSGTSAWQTINHGFLDPAFSQVADINRDGRADVFSKFADGSWRVSYSGTSAWQVINNGDLYASQTWIADLNGDIGLDVFSVLPDHRWVASYNGTGAWTLINGGPIGFDESEGADSAFENAADLTPAAIQAALEAQGATNVNFRAPSHSELPTVGNGDIPSDAVKLKSYWTDWVKDGTKFVSFLGNWNFDKDYAGGNGGGPRDMTAVAIRGFSTGCWRNVATRVRTLDHAGNRTNSGVLAANPTPQQAAFSIYDGNGQLITISKTAQRGVAWLVMKRINSGCESTKYGTFNYEHNVGGGGTWTVGFTYQGAGLSYTTPNDVKTLPVAAEVNYYN
jgi:hypothetical protein